MNIRQQYNTIQPILLYDTNKTLDLDNLLLQRINIYGTMNIMYELKVKIPTSVINLISFYLFIFLQTQFMLVSMLNISTTMPRFKWYLFSGKPNPARFG